ncbi:PepSY-associated TM helix domain-containing protein [Nitrincola sp. A-D6]|uniref:PepSY-associated TM helix domain-containing protein n=1 Tax=Nitrincola sp. A-D6 TaxID=1545442 RepID=UPI002E0D5BC4
MSYPLLFENVSVNPYTAEIEQTRRISDLSWLEIITGSMRPLHTGDFVGLSLKLVYFFFGILLTMMVFSGMMIWTKRTFRDTAAVLRTRKTNKQPSKGADAQMPAYALQKGDNV